MKGIVEIWQAGFKRYSPDVFPYKLVTNKGELAQYYVYDVFPKIIDRELFEKQMKNL